MEEMTLGEWFIKTITIVTVDNFSEPLTAGPARVNIIGRRLTHGKDPYRIFH